MAIDFSRPNGNPTPLVGTTSSPVNHKQSAAPATGNPVSNDSVQLSQDARLLQEVSSSLDKVSVVDESKVQQVRQALADGQYSIDSFQLADKMMRFETQF